MAWFIGESSHALKVLGFSSQSGHIPRFQVQSSSWGLYGRQPIDVCLSLSDRNSFPSRVGVEATEKDKTIVISEGPTVKSWGGGVPLRGKQAEVMSNTKLKIKTQTMS